MDTNSLTSLWFLVRNECSWYFLYIFPCTFLLANWTFCTHLFCITMSHSNTLPSKMTVPASVETINLSPVMFDNMRNKIENIWSLSGSQCIRRRRVKPVYYLSSYSWNRCLAQYKLLLLLMTNNGYDSFKFLCTFYQIRKQMKFALFKKCFLCCHKYLRNCDYTCEFTRGWAKQERRKTVINDIEGSGIFKKKKKPLNAILLCFKSDEGEAFIL